MLAAIRRFSGIKVVNRRNLGQTQQFDLALRRAAMAMNQQSKADDDNRR
jgi:phage terminase Nu1 subunit (DNA packaging protein)